MLGQAEHHANTAVLLPELKAQLSLHSIDLLYI